MGKFGCKCRCATKLLSNDHKCSREYLSQLFSDPGEKKGNLLFGKTILVGQPPKKWKKWATEQLSFGTSCVHFGTLCKSGSNHDCTCAASCAERCGEKKQRKPRHPPRPAKMPDPAHLQTTRLPRPRGVGTKTNFGLLTTKQLSRPPPARSPQRCYRWPAQTLYPKPGVPEA